MTQLTAMSAPPRGVRFHGPTELHRRATLLDELRVLPVQSPLLILFHPCNFFLEPAKHILGELRRSR
jgi:hypothetical protein